MAGRPAERVCLVTGATGIGAAAARTLAAAGAAVFVVSIDAADCSALAGEIEAAGGRCSWAAADLRDESAAADAFARCREELGRLDGVLAVVGGSGRRFGDGPLPEVTIDGWEETLALNLRTAFLTAREALRIMLADGRGGAIVLVTSVLAMDPSPELFATHAYAAAKGGIVSLTRSLAARYAPDGIRVNAIAPGLVDTLMAHRAAADPATIEYVTRKQPLAGGMIAAGSIAAAAAFLLSDEARDITGQVLAVDAGWGVTEA